MSEEEKIADLEQKLKLVCSILIKKDSQYDSWIEKNIGKEYVEK